MICDEPLIPRFPVAVAPAGMLAVICELPLMPNVTPFELANATVPEVAVCVPAAALIAGCVVCAGYDALAVNVLPACPKLTLFEFEKTSDVCGCTLCEKLAVSWLEPLRPNETLLLLTKASVPDVAVCVPAAAAASAGCTLCEKLALAVSVEPAVPNVMLFAFE